MRALTRQRVTNRLDQDEFEAEVRAQQDKKRAVIEGLRERVE